jgi:putative phosphoribosyl transferase
VETLTQPSLLRSGFRDRHEAGRLLALELVETGVLGEDEKPVVIGLARGGVEVAVEIAAALHAPLDAVAVRKVGHPRQPEYGIGAVAPGGIAYVRAHDGLSDAEIGWAVRRASVNVAALDATLHESRSTLSVADATCVLVDDGLATGGTMVAAVRWARARGARRVIVAAPVGVPGIAEHLKSTEGVDEVVCLVTSFELGSIGAWYDDFHQLSDADVAELLGSAHDEELVSSTAEIVIGDTRLRAELAIPPNPIGWAVFAHGSGSGRRSPRNVSVAAELTRARIATLLFDLLTPEEAIYRHNVFDTELLARRLLAVTSWLSRRPEAAGLPIGYFGASTGAAAALRAAAELGDRISAVVSRGGRPDLAWEKLAQVRAPTLLIVGGADRVVLEVNEAAARQLTCPHELIVVPRATHLFEEPGALENVTALSIAWLRRYLAADRGDPTSNRERSGHGRDIARHE